MKRSLNDNKKMDWVMHRIKSILSLLWQHFLLLVVFSWYLLPSHLFSCCGPDRPSYASQILSSRKDDVLNVSLEWNRKWVFYLSVRFNRYWFDQVGVSRKNTAATNLLWLWCRLALREIHKKGEGGRYTVRETAEKQKMNDDTISDLRRS